MSPNFIFTIYDATLAPSGQLVEEPLGWKDASITLERHPTYFSLIEYFKGNFIWYGNAYTLIKAIEANGGADAKPRVVIGITFDEGVTTDTVFDGLLDLSQLEDYFKIDKEYKLTCPIIRNDFWAKFINREGTPVNLMSTTDVDGNAITPVSSFTLPLPCQIIQKRIELNQGADVLYSAVPAGQYGVINFDTKILEEFNQLFDYDAAISATVPLETITIQDAGTYDFDIHLYINDGGTYPSSSSSVTTFDAKLLLVQSGVPTTITLTRVTHGTNPTSGYTDFVYTGSQTFVAGDTITLYWANTSGAPNTFKWIKFFLNYFKLTANTTYPNSSTDALLLPDAAENILRGILGGTARSTSTFFATCGKNAIMKGKHVRGYPFSGKPFSMSFKDFWTGASPLLGLGLGYTTVGGVDKIEIEAIGDFFDPTPSIHLSNVPNLVRSYDQAKFVRNVEIGFSKWSAESGNGIDDPQTKANFATALTTIGKDVKQLSSFIAASLAIEQTRRFKSTADKDWRLDEETMVIHVKSDGMGGYTPVLGSDFTSVTNLNNANTRYNIIHTPVRLLLRWLDWLQGGLQSYVGTAWKFVKGEGNFAVTSQTADSCEVGGTVSEGSDISVTSSFTNLPKVFTAEIPLTWAQYTTIRGDRKKAVAVSPGTTNYWVMYIESLDYQVFKGTAKLSLSLESETTIA